jgi:AcrR family transcriptional regulator
VPVEHPYQQIVSDIRDRIASGELRPGDPVPSARTITRVWGVAIATATKAHAALRDEGLTVTRPGIGTIVAGAAPPRENDLTRERITAAAIAIADAEGMAEVSMRRIATRLGVATMSLYRHFPAKDDLVVAMIDTAVGEVRLPPFPYPRGWLAALERIARLEWAVFEKHPWLAATMSITRPQMAPSAMRLSEWVLGNLEPTGLSLQDRMYIQISLFTYVRGVASALEPERAARQDTGLDFEEWMDTQEQRFGAMVADGGMPYFVALATDEAGFDFDLHKIFDFGLARLLAGYHALITTS